MIEESDGKLVKLQRKKSTTIGVAAFIIIVGAIIVGVAVGGGYHILQPRNQDQSDSNRGILAADFSLTDLDGNSFSLADFRGSVVVIDFMATWCGPCRRMMPQLREVWEEHQSRIVLMSIDIDPRESDETLRGFAQEFPYATWIWAVDDTASLGRIYEVTFIPKTVVIDMDGYIRFTHFGVTPASTLVNEVEQLMNLGR